MKHLFLALLISLSLIACVQKPEPPLSDHSVYNLASTWENQNGDALKLVDLKDKVVVMVMIYTSCKTACPRLTADMNTIHQKVGKKNTDNVRFVFVSIDPKVDTQEKMKQYLNAYGFTGNEWLFLRSSEANTRELANVLAVKYKEISPIDFSHSNIISVFNKDGNLVAQKEGLSIDIDGTVAEVKKLLKHKT